MAEELDEGAGVPRRTISRRTVAGAIWTVPVIITAVAAPASAASVVVPPATTPSVTATVTATKVAAQQFGTKHVDFVLTLANSGNGAGTVEVLSVASDGVQGTQQGLPTTVVVPAGHSTIVNFSYDYNGNAGTASYTVSYRVSGIISTVSYRI